MLLDQTGAEAGEAAVAEPELLVSILMPCLDEAETISACIREALAALAAAGVAGEVVVADNGSTDGSHGLGGRGRRARGRTLPPAATATPWPAGSPRRAAGSC